MSLQTNLDIYPYFDDFNQNKDYYRVLFKPGVAVQARELNQLQSILQNQIEKFGDNIFKRGTIIDGCNITLHNNLPYVKIKDLEVDGTPVNVSGYENYHVKNSSGVTAYVVKTSAGYEASAPNLNTLFVHYNSSGTDSNTGTFTADDILTVYSKDYPIIKYKVNNGSSGFSSRDSVVVVPAIAIQNSSGGKTFATNTFVAGHIITNGVANATIVEVDSTSNTDYLVLKLKPLAADLKTANSILWQFYSSDTVVESSNSLAQAKVTGIIGQGAKGTLSVDSVGKITAVTQTSLGSGYYVVPYVGIAPTSDSTVTASAISQVDITPWNYLTTVTVSNTAQLSIGTGYGITVDEGIVYQKGFFSRVAPQLTVVNKYSNTGFNKSVGFITNEAFINSNQDPTLLDNASGTYNYTAPGADRLKLTPELYVMSKEDAESNTDFLPIVEFADGRPYKQNRQTVYNVINEELAKRTYEESGNYVIDPFVLSTKDSSNIQFTSNTFQVSIDPGIAYIKGYRVETATNYIANVAKGIDTVNDPSATIRVGYGNYIRVKQLGGTFPFNTGVQVELHNTAANYLSSLGSISQPTASPIGYCRIRSLILESGEYGSPDAVYRLYVFDVAMNSGKGWNDVRSVYYGGTNKGIADTVLDAANNVLVGDMMNSSLLFKTVNAMKSADTITYNYRTVNQAANAASNGVIQIGLSGEQFPYTGDLSVFEKREIMIIPKSNYLLGANLGGSATVATNSPNIVGSSTTFTNYLNIGDYVKVANATANSIGQIQQVVNNTLLILTSNGSAAVTSGNVVLYMPSNVPISLTSYANRDRTANMNSYGNTLTIDLKSSIYDTSFGSTSANLVAIYNVKREKISYAVKTPNRNKFIRIYNANNKPANTVEGPNTGILQWPMGVADVFRLRNVYVSNGASNTTLVNANTGILYSGTANAFITVTNNRFSNGDSVVYANTSGTTCIGGLTNSTTYYCVYANTSGFALSSSRGGANLTMVANTVSENHSFTGIPLYTTPTTYGVEEVTNDFYIDANHREKQLDNAYICLKTGSNAVSDNTVILVEYDCFTTTGTVKTVSSYPVNDTLKLENMTSTINTMEIPEFIGWTGRYFDLRDQFDLRPISTNTVPLTTDLTSTAIVNPQNPTAAARFDSSSELYFPVPDTNLTANITFYQGRTDRVVLDKNQNFVVKTGIAGNMDTVPSEPIDSITIQVLHIPPYPSLPSALSSDIVKIADTKMVNSAYGQRIKNFRIQNGLNNSEVNEIQNRGYTMSDIALLDKRLRDLENYVAFTLSEAVIKSKFIPSSIVPTQDRYRYGFFVEPYENYQYAGVTNPEFKCVISDHVLNPKLKELNLELTPYTGEQGLFTIPFNEYTICNQADATDGSITGTDSITGVQAIAVTQSIAIVTQGQRSTSYSDGGSIYEDFYYTFSSVAGPVEFYVVSTDNNIAVEVSQATTQNGTYTPTVTSSAALAITAQDITSKGLQGLNGNRPIEHAGSLLTKAYGPASTGAFLEDQFKLLWTHDPINGQYVRIRVFKGANFGSLGQVGTFEYKLYYPSSVSTTETKVVQVPQSFGYVGTVNDVEPRSFTISMSYKYMLPGQIAGAAVQALIADSQKFKISVTGLKPNTYHKFILNNEDHTSKCVQQRQTTSNVDGTLLSDSSGNIILDYYYDAGINEATSDLQLQNKLASAISGTKFFTVESYDKSSVGAGSITVKYYSFLTQDEMSNYIAYLNVSKTATDTSVGSQDYAFTSVFTDTGLNQTINNAINRINRINVNWTGSGYTATGYSIGNMSYIDGFNIQ